MKTNTKTNILQGITILGLGALIFGVTAMAPAHADDWHRDHDRDWHRDYDRDRDRDRDHGHVIVDLHVAPVHINTDFVFYCGEDHRPEGKFWAWDKHDHCWRRDRCR